MPDYIGQGDSDGYHPFLDAQSNAQSSYDLLQAARQLVAKRGIIIEPKIFLSGFSEGGQATLALQQMLEKKSTDPNNYFIVAGSTSIAGALDMVTVWNNLLTQPTNQGINTIIPALMARTIWSYSNAYNWGNNWSSFFSPSSSAIMNDLFDNYDTNLLQIQKALPNTQTALLNPNFLSSSSIQNQIFLRALKTNNVYNWRPVAPIRYYHGQADTIIPYSVSQEASALQNDLGANTRLITIGQNWGHLEVILSSLIESKLWFDQLKIIDQAKNN
jgi:pimeloyl-ACP methyl ester carboxylesterase